MNRPQYYVISILPVFFVLCCVGSSLCDELITRSEESYRVCVCAKLCVIYKPQKRRLRPELDSFATEKVKTTYVMIVVYRGLVKSIILHNNL
jgi:hypothetical protein